MPDPIDQDLREVHETDPAFRARLDRLLQQIGDGEVMRTPHEQVIRRFGLAEEWDADDSTSWSVGNRQISSGAVPRISAFYGIVIWLYWNDHQPPHFHAQYGSQVALVAIGSWEIIRGELPVRALRLVREWAELHEDELRQNWERARKRTPLEPVDPLP